MNARHAARLAIFCLFLAAGPLLSGCGAVLTAGGLLAVILGRGDSSSPKSAPAVTVSTPARSTSGYVTIACVLSDAQSDLVDIDVRFSAQDKSSGASLSNQPATAAGSQTADVATSPGGTPYSFVWDYATDLPDAGAWSATLTFTATDASGASLPASTASFIVGNDAPVIGPGTVFVDGSTGNVVVEYTLQDTTGDSCRIRAEYQAASLQGGALQGIQSVVGSNLYGVVPPADGSLQQFSFTWDTVAEPGIGLQNVPLLTVLLTPIDLDGSGADLATGATEAYWIPLLRNNTEPLAILTEPAISPDDTGNLALQVTIIDDESDPVDLWVGMSRLSAQYGQVLQHAIPRSARVEAPAGALAGDEIFLPSLVHAEPPMPIGPAPGEITFTQGSTAVIGTGSSFSRSLQPADEILGPDGIWYRVASIQSDVALTLEQSYGGTTALASDVERLRHRFARRTLEVLAPPGATALVTGAPLSSPAGLLIEPSAGPSAAPTALVANPGSGTIERVDLVTGTATTLATSLGSPAYLALESGGASILVSDATAGPGAGRLLRVDRTTGAWSVLATGLNLPRGVAALSPTEALVLEDDGVGRLIHVRLTLTFLPRDNVRILASGFSSPRGLAFDAAHRLAYVAERGAAAADQQISVVDVLTLERAVFEEATLGGPPSPSGLALAGDSRTLLVTTEEGAASRVFAVGSYGGATFVRATNLDTPLGVAVASDGTIYATESGANRLRQIDLGTRVAESATIQAVLRERGTIRLAAPPSAPIAPGALVRIADILPAGLAGLASSPDGVTHQIAVESLDRPGNPDAFFFRVEPSDQGSGAADESIAPRDIAGRYRAPLYLTWGGGNLDLSVDAGDLDGDGDLDLALANGAFTSRVYVFRQTSPGVFSAAAALSDPAQVVRDPSDLRVVDIDGDGDQDILCASRVADSVGVFIQTTPAGTFLDPVALPLMAGDDPEVVIPADLDGDGDLDLAATCRLSSRLAFFIQTSPGTFAPAQYLVGFFGPAGLAAGDVDADGDVDLVIANASGSRADVLLQTTPGAFSVAQTLTTGVYSPEDVALGDIDGDGNLDIAVANFGDSSILLFLQAAPGTFIGPQVLDDSLSLTSPRRIALADFDADGDLDVISANQYSDNVTIFRQVAPLTFSRRGAPLSDPAGMVEPMDLAVVDIDGDARQDIIAANKTSDTLAIFRQHTRGVFSTEPLVLFHPSLGESPVDVAAGDLDGDGDLDLVSANRNSDALSLYEQTAPGVFDPLPTIVQGAGLDDPFQVALGDLDGDGAVEIACVSGLGDRILIWEPSDPAFDPTAPSVTISDPSLLDPRGIALGDVDGDGDLDIVVSNVAPTNTVVIFRQTAPGTYAFDQALSDPGVLDPYFVLLDDVDLDGDLDIATADTGSNNLGLFRQTAPGVFSAPTLVGVLGQPQYLAIGDLDGDGDRDLVASTSNFPLSWLVISWQTSPGVFGSSTTIAAAGIPRGVAIADLDGDSDQDFAFVRAGNISIYTQIAPGVFDTTFDILTSPDMATPIDLVVADLDGDGDPDIATANSTSDNVTIFFKR